MRIAYPILENISRILAERLLSYQHSTRPIFYHIQNVETKSNLLRIAVYIHTHCSQATISLLETKMNF